MPIPTIKTAEFSRAVVETSQLPRANFPEIAFLGRSNVGKSSLINTLLGRRRLVRTSSRPGCTRSLNFFLINGCWHFVDLPGFGYAAVSREEKASWGEVIMEYLETRPTLAAVVFLQDGRRLPGPEELFLWERLTAWGRPVIPVITKADKLKARDRTLQGKEIVALLAPFGVAPEDLLWFSAVTHEGREKLWRRLLALLAPK